MSDSETAFLNSQIKYFDESTQQEGWKQNFFQTGWREPKATIHMRNGDASVYTEIQPPAKGRNNRVRLMLAQFGRTNLPIMLIDVAEGYQAITKEEYLRLKAQKNVPSN